MDVFVIWGPTAEWGDGSGPLGYFSDRVSAAHGIADEVIQVAEAGMADKWPYNVIGYSIHEETAESLDVPKGVMERGDDWVIEWLNDQLSY